MAASMQPAASNALFFNDAVSASTVSRSAVATEAAVQLPAAGEQSAVNVHRISTGSLSRAEVRTQALLAPPAVGNS